MDECQNVINFEDFDAGTSDAIYEMGQSESKKNSKRQGVPETKGTQMSFGFKKKTVGILNKKQIKQNEKNKIKSRNDLKDGGNECNFDDVINDNVIKKDDTVQNKCDDDDEAKQTACSTPRLLPPKKDAAGLPYRPNRFGFRQTNIIRPASAGITPKLAENDCTLNNNINNSTTSEKRRSKSATGTSSTRTNTSLNGSQQQQQQQIKFDNPKINTSATVRFQLDENNLKIQQNEQNKTQQQTYGMMSNTNRFTNSNSYRIGYSNSTNPIVRPTPQRASETVSKFTLHTMSLPKPQYPVPISLPPRNVMDTKVAKQAINSSKRSFQGEQSFDSGVGSFDSYGGTCNVNLNNLNQFTRPTMRNRPRNLEMVMRGKNSFDVRDLDDSLSEDSIVPLSLPKLPSAFNTSTQPAPISGLIRLDNTQQNIINNNNNNSELLSDMRQGSIASSDMESLEEDEEGKVIRDKSTSEKLKPSSPVSSILSWEKGGEQMAIKDCSSLSISSIDDIKTNEPVIDDFTLAEDISSVTLTTGNPLSSLTTSFNKVLDQINEQNVQNILLTIKDKKIAEMVESVENDTLLDDETSPTDSLISSSTESDDLLGKKILNKKKQLNKLDDLKISEIDDLSDDLNLNNPLSPGSPTNADNSNSFSLSDGAGRDFLIDDEIADQPALVYDGKDHNEDVTGSLHLQSITDTPTLIDSSSNITNRSGVNNNNSFSNNNNNNMGNISGSVTTNKFTQNKSKYTTSQNFMSTSSHHNKPKNPLITRAESLDTLSPCDSIASDDLMMDFDCNSSLDSVDREGSRNGSGSGSALHSMDETQLWSELEAQGADISREWNSLLRLPFKNSRESITPQLPVRATRLLNRRLQQNASNAGSDSPRSLDSVSRRTPLFKSHTVHQGVGHDDMLLVDRSFKTSVQQDLMHFKKQLVRLRRLLQETDTLNPFEHGQYFASCGIDLKSVFGSSSLHAQSQEERENGSLTPSSTTDDPVQELADLRRQVVFLQSQIDDKDRTIRLQQNIITKLEENEKKHEMLMENKITSVQKETISTATQTERLRPLSMGQEGIARIEHHHQKPSSTVRTILNTTTNPINSNKKLNADLKLNTTNNNYLINKFSNCCIISQNNNKNNKTIPIYIKNNYDDKINMDIVNNNNNQNNLIKKTVHTKHIGNVKCGKIPISSSKMQM